MPKTISEHERELTKKAIIEQTKKLMRNKGGIKNITVDDIVRAVGLGKGSFYAYFKSKEECIYEVIVGSWLNLLCQAEMMVQENMSTKEFVNRFVRNVFLADDVSKYISPTDLDMLLRRMPPEKAEEAYRIRSSIETKMMGFLNLSKAQAEAVHLLLTCVEFVVVAAYESTSDEAKEDVINALIETVAEYIDKNKKA